MKNIFSMARNSLDRRMASPISPGEIRRGWGMYRIKGLRWIDVYQGTFAVSFKDTLDSVYSAVSSKMSSEPNSSGPMQIFPGIKPTVRNYDHKK